MQCTIHLLLLTVALSTGHDDLRVLPHGDGAPAADRLVETDLKRQCWAALDRRRVAYEKLKTPEDCRAYQEQMRQFFRRQIGDLPERAPLEARVVGKLEGDGFRVEKVIYASQPQHHVTALVYLPLTEPPFPGVLIPCGHSHNGKAAASYQQIGMLLAQNGVAAMCYDPIGQGERYQVLATSPQEHFRGYPRNRPPHPMVQYLCTTEHTLALPGFQWLDKVYLCIRFRPKDARKPEVRARSWLTASLNLGFSGEKQRFPPQARHVSLDANSPLF